jgi:hypothetical protein
MGLALPLAVAQPERKVVVVEGDGGLLMHMGGMVTVGAVAPKNLTILLIQNGVHAASGGQPLTNAALDLANLGHTMGLPRAENIASAEAFRPALGAALEGEGPSLLALATEPDLKAVFPPLAFDPVMTKRRFMEAISAPRYVPTFFGGGKLVESRGQPSEVMDSLKGVACHNVRFPAHYVRFRSMSRPKSTALLTGKNDPKRSLMLNGFLGQPPIRSHFLSTGK